MGYIKLKEVEKEFYRLGSKDKSIMGIQEIGVLEFFLNTQKKVVVVYGRYVEQHKELFEEYPKHFGKGSKKYPKVVIAKDEESLTLFLEASKLPEKEMFKNYGELFGYPPTAIDFFVNRRIVGQDRYKIVYYGLKFVCEKSDEELDKVKQELKEMYGLELNQDNFHVEEVIK